MWLLFVCVHAHACMCTHIWKTQRGLYSSLPCYLKTSKLMVLARLAGQWIPSTASLPQYQAYRQTRPCAVGFFSFFESAKGAGDSNSGFQAFTSKHFNPLSQLMVIFSRHFPVRQSYCLTLLSTRTQMETNWLLEELNEIVLVQGMVYSEHNIF